VDMGLSFFELKENDFGDDQVREFLHALRDHPGCKEEILVTGSGS